MWPIVLYCGLAALASLGEEIGLFSMNKATDTGLSG